MAYFYMSLSISISLSRTQQQLAQRDRAMGEVQDVAIFLHLHGEGYRVFARLDIFTRVIILL